jgi:hypothetical protein
MSKYNARPTTIGGIRFDSVAESRRYQELRLLQAAGEIRELGVHPRYIVWMHGKDKIVYEADFCYTENDQQVTEDVKGVETAVFRIKAKMFRAMFPEIDFRIVKL